MTQLSQGEGESSSEGGGSSSFGWHPPRDPVKEEKLTPWMVEFVVNKEGGEIEHGEDESTCCRYRKEDEL